jgi:hypothetical protein
MNSFEKEPSSRSEPSAETGQSYECKLAYASGYFDGEGSIGILSQGAGKGSQLRIEIRSCDIDSLRLFKELFGGVLSSQIYARLPYPVFRWAVNNQEAIKALGIMAPFLKAKGKEAQLVLHSGWDTLTLGRGRLSEDQRGKRSALRIALQEIKRQNRKGTQFPRLNRPIG